MNYKTIRLLDYFKPAEYKIDIKLSNDLKTFNGSCKINGQIKKLHEQKFYLHSLSLNIEKVLINSQPAKFEQVDEELISLLAKDDKSTEIDIEITFNGALTETMHGLYPSFYKQDGEERQLISTQFESHHAREMFPCVDEPSAKAVFDVSVQAPKEWTVLSNSRELGSKIIGNQKLVRFEKTPKMSTYLLALVAGDLKFKSQKTKNGIEVKVYSVPEHVEASKFALDVAVKLLEFYEDYFGVEYPLKKLDMVGIPDFAAGAMENWGLVTYRESALLVDEKKTSLDEKQWVALVVAHELAHQWFGNIVTMAWWDDLWLNEGFASWVEYFAIDRLFPEWDIWENFLSGEFIRAEILDSLEHTHPVEVPIDTPDDIRGIFDAISYTKGASLIRMLNGFLGEDNLRKGLKAYLTKFSYKNATTDDLWQVLEDQSGLPVRKFMSVWTKQSGFPLLDISEEAEILKLEQSRFRLLEPDQADQSLWPVPFNVGKPGDHEFFDSKSQMIKGFDGDFETAVNHLHNGFYISNYSLPLDEKIAKHFASSKLTNLEKIGYISDMFMLTRIGKYSLSKAFDRLNMLKDENRSSLWEAALSHIFAVERIMGEETVRDGLRSYVDKLTSAQKDKFNLLDIPTDHHEKLLRTTLLSLRSFANDQVLIDQILEVYKSIVDLKAVEVLDPDIVPLIFSVKARFGATEDFEHMLSLYKQSTSAQQQSSIAAGLTNFRQVNLHKKVFEAILYGTIRKQDVLSFLSPMVSHLASRKLTITWIYDNWQWFVDQYGLDIMTFSLIPRILSSGMNSEQSLEKYDKFFASANINGIKRQVNQGRETIIWQSRLKSRYIKELKDYLKV